MYTKSCLFTDVIRVLFGLVKEVVNKHVFIFSLSYRHNIKMCVLWHGLVRLARHSRLSPEFTSLPRFIMGYTTVSLTEDSEELCSGEPDIHQAG